MSDRDDRRGIDDDDDGRTIADMSGVDGHGSFLTNMIGLRGERKRRRGDEAPSDATSGTRSSDDRIDLTREERRWYIFGALGASFLIFLAFAVGLTLIVLLWMLFWN